MLGSVQDKLKRVRPPRVKITYDVETGGAIEQKELPFIVGIFADLSGEPQDPLPPVKERKLTEIDRDNFDKVMATAAPRVSIAKIPNVLPGAADNATLSGALVFNKMEEFNPRQVVDKVAPLRDLYATRNRLRTIQSKAENSDKLSQLLDEAVTVRADDDTTAVAFTFVGEDGTKTVKSFTGAAIRTELTGAFTGDDPTAWRAVAPAEQGVVAAMLSPECMLLDESQRENCLELIGQYTVDILSTIGKEPEPEAAPEAPAGEEDPDAPLTPAKVAAACKADLASRRAAEKRPPPVTSAAHIDDRVAIVDCYITAQLNLIIHTPHFQELEATWRGLHYLVFRSETGKMLKLRVLNISKHDLLADMQKAVEFDQSAIFKMIYEAEYGTYGGNPYSLLVGDYYFDRKHEDMELLGKMAEIAAASHAPFISAAYSKLFDLRSFEHLDKPRDLTKIFESLELNEWNAFRDSEDSRYVTLTLPRVLLRLPYGADTVPVDGLEFEEDVWSSDAHTAPDAAKFLWGNSAFILAERITNAFSLYKWTAAIRGVKGGGLVEGLPSYTFKTAEGDVAMVCPTQVTITDRREKELNDLGFMAICHCKNTNQAAFFGGQTVNQPKLYLSDAANSNSRISAMLPYILAASRFAHYIKVIMREKIGSFMTRGNVEAFLNDWIAQYVLLDDDATQEVKAAYPLRAAQVVVTDVPGKPGAYNATVFLKPHFQLEELTTSIRLVAELPS